MTAVAPLTADTILSLARRHLDGMARVHVAPDVPARKERSARESFAAPVEAEEPMFVLYDDTMWGGGQGGFVITPRHLCWRNFMEHPRRLRWDELVTHALGGHVRRDGRHLFVHHGRVPLGLTERDSAQVARFFESLLGVLAAPATPYRVAAPPTKPRAHHDDIVSKARTFLGERPWIHYHPAIPAKLLMRARIAHGDASGAPILVLYDDTVLGSGTEGFLLGEDHLRWRNLWCPSESACLQHLAPGDVTEEGDRIRIRGKTMDLRMRPGIGGPVAGLLRELAASRAATPHHVLVHREGPLLFSAPSR